MNDFPYLLEWENDVVGWVVMKASVAAETKRDGTPNPLAGTVTWEPYKYPGKSLNTAAATLLNAALNEGQRVRTYEEWKAVYDEAVRRVAAALEAHYGPR
jgi:hypothetical protein